MKTLLAFCLQRVWCWEHPFPWPAPSMAADTATSEGNAAITGDLARRTYNQCHFMLIMDEVIFYRMQLLSWSGFEIGPIRVSEKCQNLSGQVKCRHTVIWRTSQFEIRLTEITKRQLAVWHVPCRHRWRRCVSCWRAAGCSWSHSPLRVCCFWAIIHVFKCRDAGCQICRRHGTPFLPLLPQFKLASRLIVGHVSQG